MIIHNNQEPSPEAKALAWAVLTAAASAAGAAVVNWFFAEAQRRVEAKPCAKCAERENAK